MTKSGAHFLMRELGPRFSKRGLQRLCDSLTFGKT